MGRQKKRAECKPGEPPEKHHDHHLKGENTRDRDPCLTCDPPVSPPHRTGRTEGGQLQKGIQPKQDRHPDQYNPSPPRARKYGCPDRNRFQQGVYKHGPAQMPGPVFQVSGDHENGWSRFHMPCNFCELHATVGY